MLQGEHSAILSTFINLTFVIKIFVLSILEWPLKTGFTVTRETAQVKKWVGIPVGSHWDPDWDPGGI